jgi:hypothetical protein
MPKGRSASRSGNDAALRPIEDMSALVSPGSRSQGAPATLGGVSFQGTGRCAGLLRRSTCD